MKPPSPIPDSQSDYPWPPRHFLHSYPYPPFYRVEGSTVDDNEGAVLNHSAPATSETITTASINDATAATTDGATPTAYGRKWRRVAHCPECNKSFQDKETTTKHQRMFHCGTNCLIAGCGYIADNEASLRLHLLEHLKFEPPCWVCTWGGCGKPSNTEKNAKACMITHHCIERLRWLDIHGIKAVDDFVFFG